MRYLPPLPVGILMSDAIELPSCPVRPLALRMHFASLSRASRRNLRMHLAAPRMHHPLCACTSQVCLERLDPSITGIVTIVCDHSFHCEVPSTMGRLELPSLPTRLR